MDKFLFLIKINTLLITTHSRKIFIKKKKKHSSEKHYQIQQQINVTP